MRMHISNGNRLPWVLIIGLGGTLATVSGAWSHICLSSRKGRKKETPGSLRMPGVRGSLPQPGFWPGGRGGGMGFAARSGLCSFE